MWTFFKSHHHSCLNSLNNFQFWQNKRVFKSELQNRNKNEKRKWKTKLVFWTVRIKRRSISVLFFISVFIFIFIFHFCFHFHFSFLFSFSFFISVFSVFIVKIFGKTLIEAQTCIAISTQIAAKTLNRMCIHNLNKLNQSNKMYQHFLLLLYKWIVPTTFCQVTFSFNKESQIAAITTLISRSENLGFLLTMRFYRESN